MGYTRDEAVVLAVTTLNATGSYQAVYNDFPNKFEGQSPVAVAYGQGYRVVPIARGMIDIPSEIAVIILVWRDPDQPTAAGQQKNELIREAMLAFHAAGFENIRSDAGTSIPQRIIDGEAYTVERIVMTMEE